MKRTVLFMLLAFGAGVSTGLAEWRLDQDYKFGNHAVMISEDAWAAQAYTSGILDTLVHVSKHGMLDKRILKCVFNGDPWHHVLVDQFNYMREASREAVNNGHHDTTPVEEFFARLEEDCPPEV